MRRTTIALITACALALVVPRAQARVTKGPWVQKLGPSSVVVRVEVDPPSPVTLELLAAAALRDGGASRVVEDKEARALHAFPLGGLDPSARYPYAIRVPGDATYGAFTTAPREGHSEAFRLLIYGDNRTDDAAHAAVVRAMVAVQSDFLLHTGDFVEDGASARDWQTFFEIEAPLLRERCLFACVGNHELTDGAGIAFARFFGPGEPPPAMAARALDPQSLAGTFRWANARFFLVNGMVPYRGGPDRSWLERALEGADAEPGVDWRVVVVHHGPWSSGPHGDNVYLQEAGIPELLKAHKVDLVVSGHDHIYERGVASGMPYVISGGGGAPTYRVKQAKASARKVESVRHFVEASVSQAAITLRTIRVDGSTLERCALRKGAGWDCDEAKPAATTSSTASSASSQQANTSTSSAAPPSRCACTTPGRSAGGWGGGLAAVALAALSLRRRRSP